MGNWTHIEKQIDGTVNELSRSISNWEKDGKIFLPDLRKTENIYIFSDYSGNSEQKLISYSLLIIDEESLPPFLSSHHVFWKNFNLGNRIIEYKGLNDEFKRRALVPFLNGCNNLNGLVCSVLFERRTKSLFREEIPVDLQSQLTLWKNKKVLEKFLRLREIVLLILNGLGNDYQNVLWITDPDDFVSNDPQLKIANIVLKQTLNKHLRFPIGNFELTILDDALPDRVLEKLCSIPDLVAGGLVDFIGDYIAINAIPSKGEIIEPIYHSKDKVNAITNWLSKNRQLVPLKKLTLWISETDDDNFSIQALDFPEFPSWHNQALNGRK